MTTTLIKELARNKSKNSPKPITDALRSWMTLVGIEDTPDALEFNKNPAYASLELAITVNGHEYAVYLIAIDTDMLLTVSIYINPPIPRKRLRSVKDWILRRNQHLATGQFQLTSDEKFLLYFNTVNFAGAKNVETIMIDNLFTDAANAVEIYISEFLELIPENAVD